LLFRCGAGVANFRVDGWGEWRGVTHHRILHATSVDLIGAVLGNARCIDWKKRIAIWMPVRVQSAVVTQRRW
jgi:hypothetical protein